MFTDKLTLFITIGILAFQMGVAGYVSLNEEQEPWRCQSLAQGVYEYMNPMAVSSLNQIADEPLWTFKWDRDYPAEVVSATLAEALRMQGAILQNNSIRSKYLPDGTYLIISNYKINGTTCSISLTLGSRNVWVSHGPHKAN